MAQDLCACLGELVDRICSGDPPKPLEAPPQLAPRLAQAPAPASPVATLAVPDAAPLEVEKSEAYSEGKAVSITESRGSRRGSPGSAAASEGRASTKKRRGLGAPLRSPRAMPPAVLREDPASRAFFCGHWPGSRNDYEGEAGFRIMVEMDFELTALGRPCEPPLMEAALVSVWHVESQECLASTMVGPTSRVEGFYAWEPLLEPLVLRKGQEYRFSQKCRANMPDRWCDEYGTKEELNGKSWASLAEFLGGVVRHRSDCEISSYPNKPDGMLRRAGIVNFKAILRPGPEPELRSVDRERFAKDLAVALTASTLPMAELELRLAALAGLLALLVDELTGITAMALLAPMEELEIIAASAAAVSPLGELELAGASVFDSKALCNEMCIAARRSGMLDAGLLLVSFTGEVLGLVLRPRFAGGAAAAQAVAPQLAVAPMVFDQGRPLQPWEIARQLPTEGLTLARQLAGDVFAFDAKMQHDNPQGLHLPRPEGSQII